MKLLKVLIGIMEPRSAFVFFNPIYLRLNNVKKCNLPRIVTRAMIACTGIRKKKQGIKIMISLTTLNSTSSAILMYTFSCRRNFKIKTNQHLQILNLNRASLQQHNHRQLLTRMLNQVKDSKLEKKQPLKILIKNLSLLRLS